MIKFYTFLLLLIFFNFNLSAEIVQKLEVSGNQRISDETIKVYGEININKDYSTFEINKILKNLYDTNFFEDIKISLTNGVLLIAVKENATINSVKLEGEKSKTITKDVLKKLQLKVKESFVKEKLSQDLVFIKNIYASIGYNFIQLESKIEKLADNRINLIYYLEKGKKTNISKINFIGDKKIKDKRLRDIIASEENKFWKFLSKNTFLNNNNIELDKRLLINYYKSLGYYDVQVLSSNAEISEVNETNLTYTINAGPRYKINKISTNVSSVFDKKIFIPLQDNFTKIIGKYYSPFKVKKLLDELDRLIANNDLQFIEHSVNEILEGDSIEITINIFEGKKMLVEKINIAGNTVTNETVIRAELLLDEGDPFSRLNLDKTVAKLKARNIFSKVENKVIEGSKKNLRVINISVEEKPTGEISAGAGIGTTGGSLSFSVTENNWLGRGVSVTTSLDISAETFTGGLQVTDPNYKFSGNSLSYFATNTSNDRSNAGYKNNITSLGIGTSFEQYKNVYLSPNLSFSYDDLKVESSASKSLQKQKGTFKDLSFDYSISSDKRDKVYAPTDGYITRFSQALPIYADSPYLKNSVAFTKYQTLSQNAIGSFKLFASAINSVKGDHVRLSKRLMLSGNKIRGFEAGKIGPKDGVDFIGGNYLMASNFEVSLPNFLPESTKTDVGFFLDFANVWHADYDDTLGSSSVIRSSTGIVTDWISPIGPMSFVLAQNLSKATTDITETFNFKLGTTF